MQKWIQAARPKTLVAAVAPVVIGVVFAKKWDLVMAAMTLLAAVGIQIGTNLVNDYFDFLKGADTAMRKGPVRLMQAQLVTPQAMRRAIIVTFLLTALSSFYLVVHGGPGIAILSSISVLLAFAYTTGPLPLSYLGLGDLFVLLFFGPVATAATYYLQTGAFSSAAALLGIGPGLLSMAILTANNLRDVEEDSRSGKKTVCVRFGANFGRWEYTVALLAAPVPFLMMGVWWPAAIWVVAPKLIWDVWKSDPAPLLAKTGALLWVYTILCCL